MQSHASRHAVSEFLKDLHQKTQQPPHKDPKDDGVTEAFGRWTISNLIEVLDLPTTQLSDEGRAHCLRVLLGLLSAQEKKAEAVQAHALKPLLFLIATSGCLEVCCLSCLVVSSLCQLRQGRQEVLELGGISVLTLALQSAPEAAVAALRVRDRIRTEVRARVSVACLLCCLDGCLCSSPVPLPPDLRNSSLSISWLKCLSLSADGLEMMQDSPAGVMEALVGLINKKGTTPKVLDDAIHTAAALTLKDPGVEAALSCGLPLACVHLCQRALQWDLSFNPLCSSLLAGVALALRNMSQLPQGKEEVRMAGGITALSHLLQQSDTPLEVIRHTTGALMAVSIDKASKVPIMNLAGRPLLALLHHQDPAVATQSHNTLHHCSEHLEARRMLELWLTPQEQEEKLGTLLPTPPDYRYRVHQPAGSLGT